MSTKPKPSDTSAPTPARNPNLNPAPLRLLTSLASISLLAFTACQTPSPPPQTQVTTTVTPLPDTIERRVAELKLTLPTASKPGPTATLTSVVVSGNLAFVSGHISRAADGNVQRLSSRQVRRECGRQNASGAAHILCQPAAAKPFDCASGD